MTEYHIRDTLKEVSSGLSLKYKLHLVKHAIGHESNYENHILTKHDYFSIMPYHCHQVTNIGDEPLKILEIQYGSYLEEDDIEREEIL